MCLAGQTLELLPDRAAFWLERGTLLVADCHFGKAASLRRHGLAVPEGATLDDLARLDGLLSRTGARRVVVVGDLFHAPSGYAAAVIDGLVAWRRRHALLPLVLAPGNHDRSLHLLPSELGIDTAGRTADDDPLVFVHDPADVPEAGSDGGTHAYVCGHLHPAVRVGDRRVRGASAPCFWLQGGRVLVLPSFGSFTGSVAVEPGDGDRIFALAGGRVVEVPARVLGIEPAIREK